ncbi:hypothetical protein MMC19_000420 [Ptychographa xylographoides]|nr:hypothetical protein [Ptychographa xylographoides]
MAHPNAEHINGTSRETQSVANGFEPVIDWTSFANIINGQPRTSGKTYHSIDPSTLEPLWEAPISTSQDVDDSVAAARAAFPSWSLTPVEIRAKLLVHFGNRAFHDNGEALTALLQRETGKPAFVAGIEVANSYNHCTFHENLRLPEERWEDDEKVIVTRYVPMGVVAAIIPWNFPIVLAIGKICAGLLTGNCVIVKPSPFTPYSALKMVEIAQETFPPGVLQVLGGDDRLGPWLVAHPGIQKINFTGSINTGKKIMAECAKTLKRVTLELGGNDVCIVCEDVADVEGTAAQVALGCFFNTGQMCVCTKRVYVAEGIYDRFLEAMVRFTNGLKMGRPGEEGVMVGPVQNEMQFEKVKGFFKDSLENGHKFVAGGQEVREEGEGEKGFFLRPAIVDRPPVKSRIVQEEQFGPIVPVLSFTSVDEAIAAANDSPMGLGASVWSDDVAKAEAIGLRLEVGMVYVNSFEKPDCHGYMSGHKMSGIGGDSGVLGIKEMCNVQVMHTYKRS